MTLSKESEQQEEIKGEIQRVDTNTKTAKHPKRNSRGGGHLE